MQIASIVSLLLALVFAYASAQPPACQSVAPNNGMLWPPNGKFENITITGLPSDQKVVISAIKQDEDPGAGPKREGPLRQFLNRLQGKKKDEGTAGPTSAADAIVDGGIAMIRHERLGGGDGRVYHIYFNATSTTSNETICTGEVTVCVPKSQGGGNGNGNGNKKNVTSACVDSSLNGGTLYDSVASKRRMLRN